MEPLDHLKLAVTTVETALTALTDRITASETVTADLNTEVSDLKTQITALNDRVTIAEQAAADAAAGMVSDADVNAAADELEAAADKANPPAPVTPPVLPEDNGGLS